MVLETVCMAWNQVEKAEALVFRLIIELFLLQIPGLINK